MLDSEYVRNSAVNTKHFPPFNVLLFLSCRVVVSVDGAEGRTIEMHACMPHSQTAANHRHELQL